MQFGAFVSHVIAARTCRYRHHSRGLRCDRRAHADCNRGSRPARSVGAESGPRWMPDPRPRLWHRTTLACARRCGARSRRTGRFTSNDRSSDPELRGTFEPALRQRRVHGVAARGDVRLRGLGGGAAPPPGVSRAREDRDRTSSGWSPSGCRPGLCLGAVRDSAQCICLPREAVAAQTQRRRCGPASSRRMA